jgi:hypothetical protein
VLLRNVFNSPNHWVTVKLVGTGKSPHDGTGATVYLSAGPLRQRRDVISGSSYASSSDPRLHFGLGSYLSVQELEVHWPDGTVQKSKLEDGVDRSYLLEQGKAPVPLKP